MLNVYQGSNLQQILPEVASEFLQEHLGPVSHTLGRAEASQGHLTPAQAASIAYQCAVCDVLVAIVSGEMTVEAYS